MAELLLGIDGGGSRTRALIADRTGTILGRGTAGTSNYQSVGFAMATQALSSAIETARRSAGVAAETLPAAACFGLAGVGRAVDHALFDRWVSDARLARRHVIVNDAELVLAAGTPEHWGVALICGTGSICYGRAADGTTARAGGWGYLLGDEGGGYDLAVQALRLATQTADGRADAHAILEAVLQHWELDEPTRLISCLYRPEVTRAEIAGLARDIVRLADAGDTHAAAIMNRAVHDLGKLVETVVRKLGLHRSPIACAGGLLGGSPRLREKIYEGSSVPLEPTTYVDEPARGALVIAGNLLIDGDPQ